MDKFVISQFSSNQPHQMQSDLFDCSICCLHYDRSINIPKIIPSCGHTVCSICLNKILAGPKPATCPLDRKIIGNTYKASEEFPTNLVLLQLLDEKLKAEEDFCNIHREPKTLVCLTDKAIICRFCVEYGNHKSHKVISVTEAKAQASSKKNRLENLLNNFECYYYQNVYEFLETHKQDLKICIKDKFDIIRRVLDTKEEQTLLELQNFFIREKSKIDSRLFKDTELKKNLEDKIKDLDAPHKSQEFIEALVFEEKAAFVGKPEHNIFTTIPEEIKYKFSFALDKLDKLYSSINEDFKLTGLLKESIIKEDISSKVDHLLNLTSQDQWLYITSKNNSKSNGKYVILDGNDWKNLTKVNLSLSGVKITSDIIQGMGCVFGDLKEMSELKINLPNNEITDQELLNLSLPIFRACEKVETMELNLRGCNIGDRSIVHSMTVNKKLKNLKNYLLWLSNTKITDMSIHAFSNYTLPLLTSLQNLQLYLGNNEITDASIEQLCIKFKTLVPNLKTFILYLSNTQITDKSIETLRKNVVPILGDVENFQLGLYGTRITDTSIANLLTKMKKYAKNIKIFSLYLGKTKVSDGTVKAFRKYTAPNAPSLQNLLLDFSETKVSDSAIEKLCKKNMQKCFRNLKSFSIYLSSLKISDKTIELFNKQVLPELIALESFNLDLADTKVKDASIEELCTTMKAKLSNVKTLTLALNKTKITDKSVSAFTNSVLLNLYQLESFKLNLYGAQVNDASIQEFCSTLRENKKLKQNLKEFSICVDNTLVNSTTNQMVKEIQKEIYFNNTQ